MNELYSDDEARNRRAGGARTLSTGWRGAFSAAVVLALLGGAGLWTYELVTRDPADVPIVRALQGPTRVAPEEPGGVEFAHQGREINAVLEGAQAPLPRQVALAGLTPALSDEDKPQRDLVQASQFKTVAELVSQVADGASAPSFDTAGELQTEIDLVDDAPDLGGDPMATEVSDALDGDASTEIAEAEPETDVVAGPRPFSRPSNLRRIAAVASRDVPETRAKTTEPAASDGAAPARTASSGSQEVTGLSSGSRLVQLGAFDSEANTRAAWQRLASANSDLLSSKSLYVERATNNARVFYRLRVAGFETSDQTRQICESLRERNVDCIPVTLR
ncbi:MAG: SPOR domain-containing protein [Pseudomonadota bacterium]